MIPRRDIERRRSDTRLAILAINIVFCFLSFLFFFLFSPFERSLFYLFNSFNHFFSLLSLSLSLSRALSFSSSITHRRSSTFDSRVSFDFDSRIIAATRLDRSRFIDPGIDKIIVGTRRILSFRTRRRKDFLSRHGNNYWRGISNLNSCRDNYLL